MRSPGRRDERGGAAVLAVACLTVMLLVGAALGVVAALFVGHRTAQSAADLAALSGAAELGRGRDPCQAAAVTAEANDASLSACSVSGRDVVVEVEVAGPRWLGQVADLEAAARAGPA